MNKYTVVGFYEDDGTRFCDWVEAECPAAAERHCLDEHQDEGLVICATMDGHVEACDPFRTVSTEDKEGEA